MVASSSQNAQWKHRQAALRVAVSLFASWGLAGAALVSFTARAGEGTRMLDTEFRRSTRIEAHRLTLMPPQLSTLSLIDTAARMTAFSPQAPLTSPVLAHIRKVDLSREAAPAEHTISTLLFTDDAALLPQRQLDPAVTLARAGQALLARLNRFEGRTIESVYPGGTSGDVAAQGASPQTLTQSRPDGTTPSVSRAVSLASVTPAPMEPEVIAAAAMRIPAFANVHGGSASVALNTTRLPSGKGYLDLIDPETRKREEKCLAEAVYFESRSEPESGQAAVAQVVLNRVKSGLYPTSVCGVVYQNRHRYKACQFTFACEGKSLAIRDAASWITAQRVAKNVMEGEVYSAAVGASTHYHANYVSPYWSRKLKRTDQIGRHIFYRLRPGQT